MIAIEPFVIFDHNNELVNTIEVQLTILLIKLLELMPIYPNSVRKEKKNMEK